MVELPGAGPDRRTLRFWPWLAMCAAGAAVFGLLAWFAGFVAASASTPTPFVLGVTLCVGLGVLAVYSLASLRTSTVLDHHGSTARSAFRRQRVPWAGIERLDVVHSLPGWSIRAWAPDADRPAVVFMCHDTHGRRPVSRTYERPPVEAPRSLQRGFEVVERYWQASAPEARRVDR